MARACGFESSAAGRRISGAFGVVNLGLGSRNAAPNDLRTLRALFDDAEYGAWTERLSPTPDPASGRSA
jgi:hypothetical protein